MKLSKPVSLHSWSASHTQTFLIITYIQKQTSSYYSDMNCVKCRSLSHCHVFSFVQVLPQDIRRYDDPASTSCGRWLNFLGLLPVKGSFSFPLSPGLSS